MEKRRFSLPFFCLLFIFQSSLIGQAQYSTDTIQKYSEAILNPKSSQDIPLGLQFYAAKTENDLKRGDTLSAIIGLRLLAIGQFDMGETYDSENSAVQAISLIDRSKGNDSLMANMLGLYNHLGKIYRATENFDKALEAYNAALKTAKTLKDSIILLNNKANVHKDSGLYHKALAELDLAFKIIKRDPDSLFLASLYDNRGIVKSKLDMPEALEDLTKGLEIRESKNNLTGLYSSYKNLSQYYFDRSNRQVAFHFAERAYETALQINSTAFIQDALSLFALMDDDPKIVAFQRLTDSIANEKQLAQNKYAFMKYNVEQERKNTELAQLQKEKEKSQKIILIFLVGFVLIAGTFVSIFLIASHKKDRIHQVFKTEARISKKVHDEVANDLYHVMVKLQGDESAHEDLLDDLEIIYNKTRDISKENSALELKSDFKEQLFDLLMSYQNEEVNVMTQNISAIDWTSLSDVKKIAIYRVLKELMTNMAKHSQASVVVLTFNKIKNKTSIIYSDNGIGCNLKDKNGLRNVENRIKSLNGTITFESKPNEGFKSKITL
ncbi:MAG: tetratricopeptide repeat protein [Aequorivita sp.]